MRSIVCGVVATHAAGEDDALRFVCDLAIVIFIACQLAGNAGNEGYDFTAYALGVLCVLTVFCGTILCVKAARIVQRNHSLKAHSRTGPTKMYAWTNRLLAAIDGVPPISNHGSVTDTLTAQRYAMRRFIAIGAAVDRDAMLLRIYFDGVTRRAEKDREEYMVC